MVSNRQVKEPNASVPGARERQLSLIERVARIGYWSRASSYHEYEFSDGMYKIFGIESRPERLDRSWFLSRCHPADRAMVLEKMAEPTDPEGELRAEYRIICPSGEIKWVRAIALPLLSPQGKISGFYGTLQDITLEKETELELRQVQKTEALGQLTGGVAHDFNNLLCVIRGNLELLKLRTAPDELDEKRQFLLNESIAAVERGAALTGQLLSFGRRQYLSPRSVDVRMALTRFAEYVSRVLIAHINFELNIEPDVWPIHCDPSQLENALLNLVLNARDALPQGGTIRVSASNARVEETGPMPPSDLPIGSYVKLIVADNGIGIEHNLQERIFEPFYSTKDSGKGTGLGLSMARGFAMQSGGTLTMHSALAVGTEMTIWLPRAATNPSLQAHDGDVSPEDGSDERKVLVVDDNPHVGLVTVNLLKEFGYRALSAESMETALQIAAEHGKIDVLLTDMFLSGGKLGSTLAELLLAEYQGQIAIVVMSASPLMLGGALSIKSENWGFLAKPFPPEALDRAVRDALRNLDRARKRG